MGEGENGRRGEGVRYEPCAIKIKAIPYHLKFILFWVKKLSNNDILVIVIR